VATKKLLDATVLRHEAIASNLANLETPNYQRLDVAPNFGTELSRAMGSGSPTEIARLQPQLAIDPTAVAQGRDGNTVQLESELMQLNQNSLAHAVETQLLTGSLVKLRMAITGKS
jgi:flagellar basal-body rod protein FlgB